MTECQKAQEMNNPKSYEERRKRGLVIVDGEDGRETFVVEERR